MRLNYCKTKEDIIIFLTKSLLTENQEKRIDNIFITLQTAELAHSIFTFLWTDNFNSEGWQEVTLKLSPELSMLFGAEETISKQDYFKMVLNVKRTSDKTKGKIETILNKHFKKVSREGMGFLDTNIEACLDDLMKMIN